MADRYRFVCSGRLWALVVACGHCGGLTDGAEPAPSVDAVAPRPSDATVATEQTDTGPYCGADVCRSDMSCCIVADATGRCAFRCQELACESSSCTQRTSGPEPLCTPAACGSPPASPPASFWQADGERLCPDGSVGGGVCMPDATGRCSWGRRFCPDAMPCTSDASCPPDQACVEIAAPCSPGVTCPSQWECTAGRLPRQDGRNACLVESDCVGPLPDVCVACAASSPVACAHWSCVGGVCRVATCG